MGCPEEIKESEKEFLSTVGKYLLDLIDRKGIKVIIYILFAIILILTFISPSYIFIFFYKRSFFLEYDVIINISTILILDAVLFCALFLIHSIFNIKIDDKWNIVSSKLSEDIIKTIALMGVVSVFLVIQYGRYVIINGNENTIVGAKNLRIILWCIFGYYILTAIIKVLLSAYKRD